MALSLKLYCHECRIEEWVEVDDDAADTSYVYCVECGSAIQDDETGAFIEFGEVRPRLDLPICQYGCGEHTDHKAKDCPAADWDETRPASTRGDAR